ncbi:CARDB domain-containing protein [Candidatus Bipolaricaulota bacterium]
MRRCAVAIVLFMGLCLLSLTGSAQVETLPGLILTDLQLISQESLSHWTPAWTGPIQGATIAAWFAEHGYPNLMRDFNGDGVIDELDTIELADDFGRGIMQTEAPHGTTDVRLVVGLGNYFAEHYPDEFVLKIYDVGFPNEFAAQGYGSFAPDAIPGIILNVRDEPSIAAYIDELSHAEGIIVGLEEDEVDRNRYLAGRSFQYEQTPAGYTPLDFAWAKEDNWEEGHQGQVLETVGKTEDRFYLEFQGDWVPVEFMLALSPVLEHEVETEEHACPDDAIAYDVTTTMLGDYGEIQVEECVIRDGDFDIYFWIVTNISFQQNGCGLCAFQIPNPGLPTVMHLEQPPWNFMSGFGYWTWWLPLGSCGLQPGQTAVFAVAVPGPTTDTWVVGRAAPCLPTPGIAPRLYVLKTTGPGKPGDDPGGRCPDLVIRVLDESCYYDRLEEAYVLTVWANVVNIGSVAVTSLFDVLLTGTSHPGSDITTVLPPVPPGGGTVPVTLSFMVPPDPTGAAPCVNYELMVDSSYDIDECFEDNNLVYGYICCSGEPDDQGECPDLTINIRDVDCEMDRKSGVYILTVTAVVQNLGLVEITDAILVRMDCDRGSDTDTIWTDLAHMETKEVTFTLEFSLNEPGCFPITVEVDYHNWIVECDEDNNTDTWEEICCQP